MPHQSFRPSTIQLFRQAVWKFCHISLFKTFLYYIFSFLFWGTPKPPFGVHIRYKITLRWRRRSWFGSLGWVGRWVPKGCGRGRQKAYATKGKALLTHKFLTLRNNNTNTTSTNNNSSSGNCGVYGKNHTLSAWKINKSKDTKNTTTRNKEPQVCRIIVFPFNLSQKSEIFCHEKSQQNIIEFCTDWRKNTKINKHK